MSQSSFDKSRKETRRRGLKEKVVEQVVAKECNDIEIELFV